MRHAEELLEAALEPLSRRARALMSTKDSNTHLIQAFDEVLNDETSLANTLLESYEHPNGFIKLVLARDHKSEAAVRVHFWQDVSQGTDIHDHFWDMRSKILFGTFLSKTFETEGSLSGTLYHLRRAKMGDHGIDRVGSLRFQEVGSQRLQSGDSHYLAAGALHSFAAVKAPSATLVLQGPFRVSENRIIRTGHDAEEISRRTDVKVVRIGQERLTDIFSILSCNLQSKAENNEYRPT